MAPKAAATVRPSHKALAARERKATKPMKPIFAGKTFSLTGNFGDGWAHEKVAGWITVHGGRFEREVTEDTTHLISTLEDFKKRSKQVLKAWKLGSKCSIIIHDWLEDCLLGRTKRCRSEKGYTCAHVLKRGKQTLQHQERYRASFEEGVCAGYAMVDNRLNHVYMDQTGFEYKVVCTRINLHGIVKSEKYTLFLFESNAKPSHYQFAAKLTSDKPRRTTNYTTDCRPMQFCNAFHYFCHFFHHSTGMHWDDRLDGISPDPEKFRYVPPGEGKPVGLLPPGKREPTWKDDTSEGGDSGVSMGDGMDDSESGMEDDEVETESGSSLSASNKIY